MGIISRVRAIDEHVGQPDKVRLRESARLWWVFLVVAVATFAATTLGLLLLSSDVRFLIPLATAVFVVQLSFLAGFLFNNHLRATERTSGGWPGYHVLQ
jgi:hypothetical protein